MPVDEVDVVVVGAGAAGIAAGRRIAAAGLTLQVLEARARLGGRGFTRVDPLAGPLDLGCGWLHSADRNPWVEVIEQEGGEVVRGPTPWTRPMMEAGFPAADQAAYRADAAALRERLALWAARRDGADLPVSDFLDPASRWNGLMGATSTYVSGAEPERVSADDLNAYRDTGENWRVAGGYGAAIAAHGAGLPVAFGAPATRIDHSGRLVRVETPAGAVSARAVIVCVPSALIAAGAIAFAPDLPDKRDAAAGLPLGLADKLYFRLDRPDGFEPESRVFGRTDRAATAAYHFRPLGRPVVEAYFGGACAAELERGGEAAFVDFAFAELTRLFGAGVTKRLKPLPMHLWASDPFARGSYSYAVPGRAGDRARLAAPVDERLFFAGEACSERDFSTAHGAYRTGDAAAAAVVDRLKVA
ncbi:flavin monoamine oxidase family protein [Chenggangzhangella methanolivorans]|uniref:Tryptophan 2-monooxygenase n=1 Tax=Chenggangzhangella methanolivorans TaxID=1437009 RepID=A0A9E6RGW4_9HYPH|nr:FAD-dependent oxidoreductase [Chenggangzhangella methanolivorans]QZO00802.1 FAD-dependent oxidoreductase [Chenggangzhangella methanolivorans]